MRRVFAVALLFVSRCAGSPASPSQPPASPAPARVTFADFSGRWTAKYRITACEWERHCFLYMGTERKFDLRLVQTGSHVRGLFADPNWAVDIEGDVSTDGTLVMSGYNAPASVRDGSSRVTEIRIRLGAGLELEGQVSYENRLAPQYSDYELGMKASGEIVSATRSDLSMFAGTLDGTYHGRFVVRSCTPVSTYCYPNETDDLAEVILTVNATDGAVSATFQSGATRIPLRGTLGGRTLDLAGETTAAVSGGSTLVRVARWHAALDDLGRMSGTFHFDELYPVASPHLGGSADCELVQLVKTVI